MTNLHRNLRLGVLGFCALLLVPSVFAQGRVTSDNYQMPADVLDAGGGDRAASTNYLLDDSIGEPVIGTSGSENYALNAGYRQVLGSSISLNCSQSIALGTITATGQLTGSGTCVVFTDSLTGYTLSWRVPTGSGGTNTGSMINQFEETIAAFTPTVADTPDTWSVAATDSEWGARVRSSSTDTEAEWGTDNVSDKWLNITTGPARTIVTRSTETDSDGSDEILQYRVEIGNLKNQPTGNYGVTIVMTATSL